MPKTPSKSSKPISSETPDILHKPSSRGIVKASNNETSDSVSPKTGICKNQSDFEELILFFSLGKEDGL